MGKREDCHIVLCFKNQTVIELDLRILLAQSKRAAVDLSQRSKSENLFIEYFLQTIVLYLQILIRYCSLFVYFMVLP